MVLLHDVIHENDDAHRLVVPRFGAPASAEAVTREHLAQLLLRLFCAPSPREPTVEPCSPFVQARHKPRTGWRSGCFKGAGLLSKTARASRNALIRSRFTVSSRRSVELSNWLVVEIVADSQRNPWRVR
jgi:hypothetical protein